MRDVTLMLAGCAMVAGCAAGSMMVKGPVQQQCAGYGLQGCPELVDGVVLYLDGEKAAARLKLKRALAKNSPEQIRPFAKVLKDTVPGEAGAELAEILSGEIDVEAVIPPAPSSTLATAPTAVDPAPASRVLASVGAPQAKTTDEDDARDPSRSAVHGAEPVLLAIAASVDPSRLLTESITPLRDAARYECELLGKPSVCVRRQAGPVVVTDVVAPTGCTAELYVAAADTGGAIRWAFPVTAAGTHGAHFFVRGDEQLTVAVRGGALAQAGDVRCAAIWSGFRPRIVPMMAGTNAATLAP
jgi:hypothetical protein